MDLTFKIKKLLEEKHISQQEVANRLDYKQSVVNKLLNGKRKFQVDELIQFSSILEVDIFNLLQDDNIVKEEQILYHIKNQPPINPITVSEYKIVLKNQNDEIEYLKKALIDKDIIIDLLRKSINDTP